MRISRGLTALSLVFAFEAFAGPLHDAARQGDTAAMAALLDDGASIDEVAVMTPLQMAAMNDQIAAVELLIERGADLDAASPIIGTALHAAAQRGYADIINKLLAAGADPDVRNKDTFTPIMVASLNGKLKAVVSFIDAGADQNAIGMGRGRMHTGGDIEVGSLHLAASNGHWDIYDALIESGARPAIHENISSKLKAADPELGGDLAMKFCGNCHIVASQSQILLKELRPGPPLMGVYGRPIGSLEDYEYSEAFRKTDGVWDADMLYSFVVSANLTIPGTRMVFNDGWTKEDAIHIVAYFASLTE